MRKISILIALVFAYAVCYAADYSIGDPERSHESNRITVRQAISFSDNAAVTLPNSLRGIALYQVEEISTVDNTITVAIATENGAPLYSHTTSSSADGSSEIGQPEAFWWIDEHDEATLTLSNMGDGGTATIIITGWHK